MLKTLLMFTAVAEGAFGVLLIVAPTLVGRLLLATEISGGAITIARLAGVGLVVLGAGCWPRDDLRRARYVMLTYSVLAMVGLIVVGLVRSAGILLWPAVLVHAVIVVLLLWAGR